jgi:hypothetical protein
MVLSSRLSAPLQEAELKPKRAKVLWAVALLHACLGAPALLLADAAPSEAVPGLKEFLQETLKDHAHEEARYSSATVVLHDEIKDILVYLSGNRYCGSGGCTALLLEPDGAAFRIATKLTITRLPIRVLESRTNGWRDITVLVAGGGTSGHRVILKYNGHSYPGDPSMAPAVSAEAEKRSQELPLVEPGDTVLFTGTPPKPGFDCAKASSKVERWLCDSPVLARTDAAMADLYRQKLAAAPAESARIKSQQRDFLLRRDQCPDVACVLTLYRQRSLELSEAGRN